MSSPPKRPGLISSFPVELAGPASSDAASVAPGHRDLTDAAGAEFCFIPLFQTTSSLYVTVSVMSVKWSLRSGTFTFLMLAGFSIACRSSGRIFSCPPGLAETFLLGDCSVASADFGLVPKAES